MFKNTLATQQSVISHGDNDGIHQISAWSRSTLAFFGGRRGFLSQGLDQLSKPNILFGDIKNNYDRNANIGDPWVAMGWNCEVNQMVNGNYKLLNKTLQFPPLQLKLATPFEVILGWPISQRPLLRKKGRSAKTFWRRSKSNTLCGLLGWAAFPSNLWLLSVCMKSLIGPNHRRKFRSQTSDNMERWKAEQGRGREKRKIRREKIRRERVRRQKMQMREKVGKSRNTVFFQWFVAPEGRKVGSLKRRVRSQLARREMKNCTPLWCEAHFEVKMYKTHHSRTTFGSCDVKKVHAVVARSTFWSQNVQNTSASDHFWKLWCRKSARRCGAKHISKWKCTKRLSVGPLLEVEMSKKCTPLWREAHFQVKMYKTPGVRTTFGGCDVEKVHAVVARSTFPSQKC